MCRYLEGRGAEDAAGRGVERPHGQCGLGPGGVGHAAHEAPTPGPGTEMATATLLPTVSRPVTYPIPSWPPNVFPKRPTLPRHRRRPGNGRTRWHHREEHRGVRPQTRLVAGHGTQILVCPQVSDGGRTEAEDIGEVDRLCHVGGGVGPVEEGDGPAPVRQLADPALGVPARGSYSNAWLLLKTGLPTSPALRSASTSRF